MVAVPLVDLLAVIGAGPPGLWDGVAGPWNVCRRNFEQAQRMWIHSLRPLISVTGAIPLKFWTWLALENRSRLLPKAAIRRGTITSPAPGRESNMG